MSGWVWIVVSLLLGALVGVRAGQWRLARALRRQRAAERDAAAARRLADLGAMTAGLAHEIKNPLSTLGLNAQLLNEAVGDLDVDPDDRASLSRRADVLVRETERLRGILGDFLEFARTPGLELSRGDLNAVVDELIDFYLPQAERAGVRLRADLSPEPLLASVDAPQLKQAVLNLMLNATQAMGEP
ncbi:MAG: histidine kinase dimerization/phospho-acceptor domain-containing protein, partial [Planctomycetota bacterium]